MNRLTVNMTEAGDLCGVSRWTIQSYIRNGLPYIPGLDENGKPGRKHKRILVSALEAWLKSQQVRIK